MGGEAAQVEDATESECCEQTEDDQACDRMQLLVLLLP
jgi:hypothetical protein